VPGQRVPLPLKSHAVVPKIESVHRPKELPDFSKSSPPEGAIVVPHFNSCVVHLRVSFTSLNRYGCLPFSNLLNINAHGVRQILTKLLGFHGPCIPDPTCRRLHTHAIA